MRIRPLILATLLALGAVGAAHAGAADPCADLARHRPAKVVALEAHLADPAELSALAGQDQPPARFCRVTGVASPAVGSHIGFELWLPEPQAWNGKYLQAGNGGFAGQAPRGALMQALRRGYATAGTDGGHEAKDAVHADWALGHPERLTDLAWRAAFETNRVSRVLLRRYYRRAQSRAYFVGCSDGGRDALIAAQRLPDQFQGVVAGAPAAAWNDLMIEGAMMRAAIQRAKDPLTDEDIALVHAAVLQQCGDGHAWLPHPATCHFDVSRLACADGAAKTCLRPEPLALVKLVYGGVRDPVTGRDLPGRGFGGEGERGGWTSWVLAERGREGGASGGLIPEEWFRFVVRADPAFDLRDLTVQDLAKARSRQYLAFDATDADLSRFKAHGGRLIQFHGDNDTAIPAALSLAYYSAVRARMGEVTDFYRLYRVPGLNHCETGAGPWRADWLAALEAWVEKGQAPGAVTARNPSTGDSQILQPEP